jgi:diaminopimelate epimerase
LANDFVLFDGRRSPIHFSPAQARLLADRHRGVGGDQVLTLLESPRANAFLRIQNIDGREVEACGNAARCVGGHLMDESGADRVLIETKGGLLTAERAGAAVRLTLPPPEFAASKIPLAAGVDPHILPIEVDGRRCGSAMSLGNPHAVFIVEDLSTIDVSALGARLERDPIFPEGANIGFVQLLAQDRLRLRVWERSAGLTQACGTGSCAALIAAASRSSTGRAAVVVLDGGELAIEWLDDGRVAMTGDTETVFRGVLSDGLLRQLEAVADDDGTVTQ